MVWYILLGLLGLLLAAFVVAMVFFKLTAGRRDGWRKPEEQVYGDGGKRALFLYQPSNGGHNQAQAQALAGFLAGQGYSVTVNYPSPQLDYDPGAYDLLVFSSPVYIGETAKPLREYLASHPFTGKQVLLYLNGSLGESPELAALKKLVPEGNRVEGIKVKCDETGRLLDFVREQLSCA